MNNCCDTPTVAIEECYSYPREILTLTNYGTACGCCGETYILADLNGSSKPKQCSLLEIQGDANGGGFTLGIAIGCEKHTLNICKLPKEPEMWQSFVYSALATDNFLLTQNVGIAIVKASDFSMALSLCTDCPIVITPKAVQGSATVVMAAPLPTMDSTPKLGQFVSYAVTDGALSGIAIYDGTLYAGYLMLPDSIPDASCCVPESCGCEAAGSCRKILRTGKARVPLAAPFPSVITGNVQLASKTNGSIVAYSGTVPTDYMTFPLPHSIVMDPSTIGSSLITVVFH